MKSKLVRKHPSVKVLSRKNIKSRLYIKASTPYISALKRIKKFLDDLDKSSAEYIVILGMGKAVEKTLSLACHCEQQLGKRIEVSTKTIEVLDEVVEAEHIEKEEEEEEEEEEDLETTLRKRVLSGVEVRIYP